LFFTEAQSARKVIMTRRQALLLFSAALTSSAAESTDGSGDRVRLLRAPEGGLQPQVTVDDQGILHLVYYTGEAHQGNLYYARSLDGGASFSSAIRVNSQPGSAIAAGTIRGAQIAVGGAGRVHVAWNGSARAEPNGPLNPDSGKPGAPMLYSRLNDRGNAFEPQRNVMHHSFGLDGGGSIAADRAGNVYVAWHGIGEFEAKGTGQEGEARREVWITKSQDAGGSFSAEEKAWLRPTGACGCCGMKIFAGLQGNVAALYRSATESVHRDIYLVTSTDQGRNFRGSLLHKWDVNACPMSSMDIVGNGKTLVGAWETGGQVYWARLDCEGHRASEPMPAPGEGKGRKHPRLAVNQNGEVLLVWTEGTGWQKGGSLAWQIYDQSGRPNATRGQHPGIPAWSFAAVIARKDNGFSILY
jgi:hypothetical protein